MDVLYLASHYPLARRDHIHPYPEPEIFHVDMDSTDFAPPAKTLPTHISQVAPPAPAQYTSSPSLDSQTDEDERLFDVDVEYSNIHPGSTHQQQLTYDQTLWANIATPRAWMGEAHKVPSLEPDSRRSSFTAFATAEGALAHNQDQNNTSNNMPLYLSDYLDNSSPAHSPPTSYLPTPVGLGTTAISSSFYPSSAPDVLAQQSPYALASRYSASLQHHDPGCDPRFVSPVAGSPNAGPSSSPHHQNVGISFADVYHDPSQGIKVEQEQPSIGIGPSSILHHQAPVYETDSGEEEKSDSEEDPSYLPSSSRLRPMSLPSAPHSRLRHMRSSSAGSSTTIGLGGEIHRSHRPTRTLAPEPVPNLTKKSRGRRVPTAASLYGGGYSGAPGPSSAIGLGSGGKNARTYVCTVKECGKCFARSEHLKRHIRSIHTNDKPHRCPQPGCNKEFSRHDNLCQHMRVHRNFSAPKDGAFGSF